MPTFLRPHTQISFSPLSIPNLNAWYRGDNVTLSSGKVSSWNDKSGNGFNVTQGTGANQPTYNAADPAYNNQPTLSFSAGSSTTMSNGSIAVSQPFTAYLVGEQAASANAGFFDSTNRCVLFQSSDVFAYFAGSNVISSTNGTNTKQTFCVIFNAGSSSMAINAITAQTTGNPGTASLSSLIVGSEIGPGQFMTGKIAEILIYAGTHTYTQKQQILSYLGNRYGIIVGT